MFHEIPLWMSVFKTKIEIIVTFIIFLVILWKNCSVVLKAMVKLGQRIQETQ